MNLGSLKVLKVQWISSPHIPIGFQIANKKQEGPKKL